MLCTGLQTPDSEWNEVQTVDQDFVAWHQTACLVVAELSQRADLVKPSVFPYMANMVDVDAGLPTFSQNINSL